MVCRFAVRLRSTYLRRNVPYGLAAWRRFRWTAGVEVNWDAVSAVAELAGAVATVATLAYLAVQIRQASATSRAQIRQSIADSQIHYVNSRAIDPFLRRATQKLFYSGEALDAEELYGVRVHFVTHLRLFENHYAQYSLGTMDPEDWRAQRALLKQILRVDVYRDAYFLLENTWNARFAAEVENILAENREASD